MTDELSNQQIIERTFEVIDKHAKNDSMFDETTRKILVENFESLDLQITRHSFTFPNNKLNTHSLNKTLIGTTQYGGLTEHLSSYLQMESSLLERLNKYHESMDDLKFSVVLKLNGFEQSFNKSSKNDRFKQVVNYMLNNSEVGESKPIKFTNSRTDLLVEHQNGERSNIPIPSELQYLLNLPIRVESKEDIEKFINILEDNSNLTKDMLQMLEDRKKMEIKSKVIISEYALKSVQVMETLKRKILETANESIDPLSEEMLDLLSAVPEIRSTFLPSEVSSRIEEDIDFLVRDTGLFENEKWIGPLRELRTTDPKKYTRWHNAMMKLLENYYSAGDLEQTYSSIMGYGPEDRKIFFNENTKISQAFISNHKDTQIQVEDLMKLHEIQTAGTLPHFCRGILRNNPLYVGGNLRDLPVEGIISEISTLVDDSNELISNASNLNTRRYMARVAQIIARLNAIHPFYDGNGRVALLFGELLASKHQDIKRLNIEQLQERNFNTRTKSVLRFPLIPVVLFGNIPDADQIDFLEKSNINQNLIPITKSIIKMISRVLTI